MKKLSKLLVVLVAIICLAVSSFALAGCTGEQGAQGPKGDQGIQGPAGATGATGETGPAGQSAFDGFKAWYKEYYGFDYEGTEEDWYFSIVNQPPQMHYHAWGSAFFASMGDGVVFYQVCDDCGEQGNFAFIEDTTVGTIPLDANNAPVVFTTANYSLYSFATIEVDAANADKYLDVTFNGLAAGASIAVSIDGETVSEGQVGGNPRLGTAEPYTFMVSLSEGKHKVIVQYREMFSLEAPTGATVSIAEHPAHTNTQIADGATQIAVYDEVELTNATTYYFTAASAGTYVISVYKSDNSQAYGALFESEEEAMTNRQPPIYDFTMQESYTVIMAEGAVFNFFASIADPGTIIYIAQI